MARQYDLDRLIMNSSADAGRPTCLSVPKVAHLMLKTDLVATRWNSWSRRVRSVYSPRRHFAVPVGAEHLAAPGRPESSG